MKDIITYIIILVALSIFTSSVGAEDCIVDGKDVELVGRLQRETFPGPPNYESVEKGDAVETYWILTTEQPHNCAKAYNQESGELYRIGGPLSQFQLVLNAEEYKANQSLLNKIVRIEGQAFKGHAGHHHTAMLVDVASLETVE